jgi:glycosyltransferase involved in cell wall biosynthesis
VRKTSYRIEWLSEVTGKGCGLSFARNDAVSLRKKLDLLIGDKELRKSMGVRARKRAVSSFDWNIIAKQTNTVYTEVVS